MNKKDALITMNIILKDLTVKVYFPDCNFTLLRFAYCFCNKDLKVSVNKCYLCGDIGYLLEKF